MTQARRPRSPRLIAAGLLALVSVVSGVAAIAVEAQPTSVGLSASSAPQQPPATRSSPDAPGPEDAVVPSTQLPETDSADAAESSGAQPVQVTVPSVGIDAALVSVGVDHQRRLVVPPPELAGWFEGRPVPGEIGPAVLVGHVDSLEGPAVFHGLDRVAVGDWIHVTDDRGQQVTFVAERVQVVAKDAFPTRAVYDRVDRAELRLITCGGPFDPDAGSYRDNVIVYAVALDAPSLDAPR